MGESNSAGSARGASVTHAGAVAIRDGRVLLVRSTARDAIEWVLPKGHIERGESAEDAALRELREEAGVVGRIVRPLRTQHLPNGAVVAWFLVDALDNAEPAENRERRWLTFEEAMRLATFEETRELLSRRGDRMEMTQIYVEQVIIGGLVILTAAVLATGTVPLPDKDLELIFGFAFLGPAYVAGILYDRVADSLLERIERRARFAFAMKHFHLTWPLNADPFEQYGKKLIAEPASLSYLQSRMRILRALATLMPAMTLATLVLRHPPPNSFAVIAVSLLYLFFGLLCGMLEFPTTDAYAKVKRWPPRSVWLEPAFFGLVAATLFNMSFAGGGGDAVGVLIALGGAALALIAAWAWLRVYKTILRVFASVG